MIRTGTLIILLTLSLSIFAQEFGIGQWRDHLPYNATIGVAQMDSRIYCATPYALFYIDKEDASIGRINKVTTPTGLSDVDITALEANESNDILIVSYRNANLDILEGTDIYNISDIKRSTLVGNKTINNIHIIGDKAYLACGFGIVVLDISGKEIRDTWIIGPGASYVNVLDITFNESDNSFYAATDEGIYRADASSPNLADFNEWEFIDILPVPDARYNVIESFGGKVFTNLSTTEYAKDTIYVMQNNQWSYFDLSLTSDVNSIRKTRDEMTIAYAIKFKSYDSELNEVLSFYTYGDDITPNPMDGILDDEGVYWVADGQYGLDRCTGPWGHTLTTPNGPTSPLTFGISSSDDDVWISAGGYNQSWAPLANKGLVFHFSNEVWETFNERTFPAFDTIRDISAIAIDPSDRNHIFIGSFGYGLHEMQDGEIVQSFGADNSPLAPPTGYPQNRVRVSDLKYDDAKNLWASVSLGGDALTVMKPDGEWVDLVLPSYASGTEVGNITIDNYGQKWIIMREAGAVLVFNDNGTVDDTSDDQTRKLTTTAGNGAFPGSMILSLACDLDGEIWIGTNEGIGVIYNPENVFLGGSYDAQQILVEYDGYVRPLLETESITAITIDGANRKWIGTDKAGVFVLSDDGTEELAHYTEDNSPLLSNTISAIKINDRGEVFIGTSNGVVSYMSTATPGGPTNEDVYAYPNPVREGYEGTIAIKGLVQDAYVKITDVSGNMVYNTRAEGGQAVWDGKTMYGDKVATGVYLVFISDNTAENTMITKIMVIR